jgi:hypothetical protein
MGRCGYEVFCCGKVDMNEDQLVQFQGQLSEGVHGGDTRWRGDKTFYPARKSMYAKSWTILSWHARLFASLMLVLQVQRVVLRREVLQLTVFLDLIRQTVRSKLIKPGYAGSHRIHPWISDYMIQVAYLQVFCICFAYERERLILCVVSPCHLNTISHLSYPFHSGIHHYIFHT